MGKVDLHIHSNYSDGSDSISVLINNIKSSGIEIFALTDHDIIQGCEEIAPLIPNGITFIPSVELTCKADDIKCHILAYNCNPKDKTLNNLIQKGKLLRRQKLETRINHLKTVWGIDLTDSEKEWLYSRRSVLKIHIANILVNRGLADNNIDAMKKYLNDCKTGNTRFTITEALEAINSAGGIPIWAHPLGGEGEVHISEQEFLPKLDKMLKFGIKGLECYYSRYSEEEKNILLKVCTNNNLFITGGSDYHGTNKDVPLAKLNVNNDYVDSSELTILNYLLKNKSHSNS